MIEMMILVARVIDRATIDGKSQRQAIVITRNFLLEIEDSVISSD